ncbi:hypothetical protein OUZ56_012063 [Daphnia magna]|uniref:Uncharacterized protein n=1 Tax=Daphnia magna TaxID=35525 RepID=A0ABQ9Z208_9CRUS|nr:hypothetical protein OUZ56_012063 [Daphnia magna]
MDDPALFAANNAAVRIAATSRSRPVSPSIAVTIMDASAEAAAQAVVSDPVISEIARLTRLRTTTRRQITNTCTQFASAIRKGKEVLLKEARNINNQLLEGAEPEKFGRQQKAHTRYVQQVKAVETELQWYLASHAHLPPSIRGNNPPPEPSRYFLQQSSQQQHGKSQQDERHRIRISLKCSQHPLSGSQVVTQAQRQTEARKRANAAQLDLKEAE